MKPEVRTGFVVDQLVQLSFFSAVFIKRYTSDSIAGSIESFNRHQQRSTLGNSWLELDGVSQPHQLRYRNTCSIIVKLKLNPKEDFGWSNDPTL